MLCVASAASETLALRGAVMAFRIAILDDHRAFGEAISHALTAFYDIESVGVVQTINALVALAHADEPEVLLIDYQLVEGTGIDCARRIVQEKLDARMILLTAHASADVTSRALSNGFERVLSKEAPLDQIADAIRVAPGPQAKVLVGPDPVQFSRRQREVLDLMGQGMDPASIATQLFISVHTARSHVKDVLRLLGASTQLSAVTNAIREGYLLPPTKNDYLRR